MSYQNSPNTAFTEKEMENIKAHKEENSVVSAPEGLPVDTTSMYDDTQNDVIVHDQKAMASRIDNMHQKLQGSLNDRVKGDNDPAVLLEQATAEMDRDLHQDDFGNLEADSDVSEDEKTSEVLNMEEDDMADNYEDTEDPIERTDNVASAGVTVTENDPSYSFEDTEPKTQDVNFEEGSTECSDLPRASAPVTSDNNHVGAAGNDISDDLETCMGELEMCKKIIQIQAKNLEDTRRLLSETKNHVPSIPHDNKMGEIIQCCNEYIHASNLPSHDELWSLLSATLDFKITNPFRADVANGVMSLMLAKYNQERQEEHSILSNKIDMLTRTMNELVDDRNAMSEDISSLNHALLSTSNQQDQLHNYLEALKTTMSNLVANIHILNTGVFARSMAPTVTPVKTDFKPANQKYTIPTVITPDGAWKDLHVRVCKIEANLTEGQKIPLPVLGKLLNIGADKITEAINTAKKTINDPSWTDHQLLVIVGSTFARNRHMMKELISLYTTEISIPEGKNIPLRLVLDFYKKRVYKNPHPDTQAIFLDSQPKPNVLREVVSNRSIHPSEPQGLVIG